MGLTDERLAEFRQMRDMSFAAALIVAELCDEVERLREALRDRTYALEDLLAVAERMRGGDPSLDPEEWYATRDYARKVSAAASEREALVGEQDTTTKETET